MLVSSVKVSSRVTPLHGTNLATSQHENVLLLLRESQLPSRQPRHLYLVIRGVELLRDDPGRLLLPRYPIQRHLTAHVVVQGAVRVVRQHLLAGAVPFAHRLEAAVPVQELEDGHEFLEFQHGFAFVGFQHEAESAQACARVPLVVDGTLEMDK